MRRVASFVFIPLAMALCPLSAALAQDAAATKAPASPYLSITGTVTKADAATKVLSVKPEKGEDTTVKFDERTSFMRLPAGETDIKKSTAAEVKELEVGDKVVARVLTADPTGKPARTVYFTKQSDITMRQKKTEEEWKTATSGLVTAVDAGAKQIKFNLKMGPAMKEVTVDIAGKVDFQRYNPETGKYEASTLDKLRTGDQLRVLGEKNLEAAQIKAEAVGFGSFRTVGVLVKTIDGATNVITGTETTAAKTPVVIALRTDTSLKKFSDMAALMVARQLNPSYQQVGGGRGGRGGGAPQGGGAPPAGGGDAAGGGRGGPGGGGRGGGRGPMDIGKIIEQQPAITLADLKAGDAIIVTGAFANDATKLTATALVAGVEQILRAAPNNGADPLAGSWNMGGGGGDGN